ncbi:MAG: hypothetical protein K2K32_04935, partial [Muribaculaceae bacterium]|nr:hypothetical protein [Muribaculaceae bacterium]
RMGLIGLISPIGQIGLISLIGLIGFQACGRGGDAGGEMAADSLAGVVLDSVQAEHDISLDARAWSDSIMDTMTLEELAGQLIMPAVFANADAAELRLLREYATDCHVGGVVLLKGTVEGSRSIADTLRAILKAPPFIAIDAEWGLAMRLEGTPEFPRNGRISQETDETVMFDYGYEVARECREIGINMVLGPVLDVLPKARRSSGIGSRSFGNDADRVANLGVAYAKGLESGGVISVAKHFPGHGSADADSHKRLPIVAKSRDALEQEDLLPFREYIGNGLSGIMTGHLNVPALDGDDVPVTVSEKILKEFVRGDLGFSGLIVTDALNMAGAGGYSAADAIMAGADIVLAPADTEKEVGSIIEAVRSGRFSVSELRERVGTVLFFKYMNAKEDYGSGKIGETAEADRINKLLR